MTDIISFDPLSEQERLSFNPRQWNETDNTLSSQTANTLEKKGYNRFTSISTAITKDSSLLHTQNGFRKNQSGMWIHGPMNIPVEINSTELNALETRMPGLKDAPKVLDGVMSRYLEIRYALSQNIGTTDRPDQKMVQNPKLIHLAIETAFYRETQGGAEEYYSSDPTNWRESQEKQFAISHGQRVAREFAELLPDNK